MWSLQEVTVVLSIWGWRKDGRWEKLVPGFFLQAHSGRTWGNDPAHPTLAQGSRNPSSCTGRAWLPGWVWALRTL